LPIMKTAYREERLSRHGRTFKNKVEMFRPSGPRRMRGQHDWVRFELANIESSSEERIEDEIFQKEKAAFLQLKDGLLMDPRYAGKYVAIVESEPAAVGEDEAKVARAVYDRLGYVTMYVGKVSEDEEIAEEPSFETE
jgi:hypothetical protein